MDYFFRFPKKIGFSGILGPPYCGIGATIRIGREILCLPYAGFLCMMSIFPICSEQPVLSCCPVPEVFYVETLSPSVAKGSATVL